jgi:hypothetical protein
MKYETINMKSLAGKPILSGAIDGKAGFLAIFERARAEPPAPSPLLLDYADIEVATASYLREAVFALKTVLRTSGSKFYPVVANANATVREELTVIADARKDALLAVETADSGAIKNQIIIGALDPKQATTFERVAELKRASAGEMKDRFGAEESSSAPTVWNNRLASLAAQGLILEFTQGRAKFYTPLFGEVG